MLTLGTAAGAVAEKAPAKERAGSEALFPTGKAGELSSSTKTLTIEGGTTLEVEAGHLLVPQSRQRDSARLLSIPYYRMRTTSKTPATPIFLLAGGPGSSWIKRVENEENFREVMLYREIADVVLFDQRGGGTSLPQMECDQRRSLPPDAPLDPARIQEEMRGMARECRDFWLDQGVDLAAFTTEENAADVNDLRRALGYPRISLVGGSYGSHLALHLLRRFPKTIDRLMLYGVEGPDHTWDDPAAILATLQRIAAVAEASEELGPHIPKGGLIDALRRVQERLEKTPVTVSVQRGDQERSVLVDRRLIQRIARVQAGRRSRPSFWPELILDMDKGNFELAAQAALSLRTLRLQDPMHYMMDCASGISDSRRQRLEAEPAASILGDLSFEYSTLCDVWDAPDLGAEFRAAVVSEAPVLIFHGTWDTSTPLENARETVRTLKNGHLVEVVGGTHGALYNLYEDWPPMKDLVRTFLSGGVVEPPPSVTLPAVEFQPRRGEGA